MKLFIGGKSYGEVNSDVNVIDYDGRPSVIKHRDWKLYNIIPGMVQKVEINNKVIFENKQKRKVNFNA